MYRRLANELRLFRRATLAQGGEALSTSVREHREIMESIAAGKPAAAGRALYDHVMASRARMHRLYGDEQNPRESTTRPPRPGSAKRAARIKPREPESELATSPESGGRRA
jgi:hypothetical protein